MTQQEPNPQKEYGEKLGMQMYRRRVEQDLPSKPEDIKKKCL